MSDPIPLKSLPTRPGGRPQTTSSNPHTQLDQQPEDLAFVEKLKDWAFGLDFIQRKPSTISVPGAMAMCMDADKTCDGCSAFMIGTEFAHFHPHPDHSMHLGLTQSDAELVIEKGWGEWHPLITLGFLPPNIIMMYAPRNDEEFEATQLILKRSYEYARGISS